MELIQHLLCALASLRETNIGTLTVWELEPVEKIPRQCLGLDEWLHLSGRLNTPTQMLRG